MDRHPPHFWTGVYNDLRSVVAWVADGLESTGSGTSFSGVQVFEFDKSGNTIADVKTYWEASAVISALDAENIPVIEPSPRLNVESIASALFAHLLTGKSAGLPSFSDAPCTSDPGSGSAPCTSDPGSGSAPCTSDPIFPCGDSWGDGIYPYGDRLAWDWINYLRTVRDTITRHFLYLRVVDQESWTGSFAADAVLLDSSLDGTVTGSTKLASYFSDLTRRVASHRIVESKVYMGRDGGAAAWDAGNSGFRGISVFAVSPEATIKSLQSWYMQV